MFHSSSYLVVLLTKKTVLFSSRSIHTFWTVSPLLDGTQFVLSFPALLTALAVIDILLDAAILTLPIPIIVKLQLPPIRKMSIIAIFLSGSL
jgi:hypothetical protein